MFFEITTTTNSKAQAVEIANILVKKKLVACVQIDGPILSVYSWKKSIQEDQEWRLIMKTKDQKYDQIETEIHKLHNYDIPEIICKEITHGSKSYLDWIEMSIK